MDPTVLSIIALILGLAIGAGAGWFLSSQKSKLAEQTTSTLRSQLNAVTAERDTAKSNERAADTKARDLEIENATLKRDVANVEKQLELIKDAQEKLTQEFEITGAKVFEGLKDRFQKEAKEQLAQLNKDSLSELEKKVQPISSAMERYKQRIEEIEKNNSSGFERLKGVISEVRDGQKLVIDGANQIATTLRGATKARGDWGEIQFQNLLERCNLRDVTDFNTQVTVDGESGKLRPDAVINIPGERKLVVDVKNVFNTYAAANEAETEEQRSELLKAHAREIRTQIDQLSAKRYQDHIPGSADFVVMFVPGEHVLYSALSNEGGTDGGLLAYALERNVVLSSPLNFMSIALTIATIWRQAGAQADAEEIARLGKELYDRLGVVAERISTLRRRMQSANDGFDDVVKAFDGNLRVTGERFKQLSVDTSAKSLDEVALLQRQPRAMRNFPDGDVRDGDQ